jgi:hypothetical protein
VERPATLCIPLLLATFSLSRGSRSYARDFFELRTDFWLTVYWLLLCATLTYLLLFGARALLILRRDPRSRRVASVYLVATASGIMTCVVRAITALVPPCQGPVGAALVWLLACLCGVVFAFSSAHAWQQKVKWFQRPAVRS